MDRLDAVRVFVRVAELASFSRAAEDLGLPRATVSVAIAGLEAAFGVRLIHRTTRSMSLTSDGAVLLERGRLLVDDFEAIRSRLDGRAKPIGGRLSVNLPSRLARCVLIPALPDLLARHPGLAIDVSSDDRHIDLVEAGVDCVVRIGALSLSSLVALPLGQLAMVTCASPAYLAAHPAPDSPADLAGHWAVNYDPTPGAGREARETLFDHQAGEGESLRVPLKCRVTVRSTETYVAAAIAGLGLIQVPAFDVRESILRGDLREVLPTHLPPPMPVHALYPHRRHPSARLRLFLGWVKTLLQPLLAAP